jgi:hypothetical protein
MSEWQPIETAPKDGTRVLLYYRNYCGDGWLVTIGEWNDQDEPNATWEHEFGSGDADAWQHLPSPPEAP